MLIALAAVLLTATPAQGPSPGDGRAVIVDSGSTNTRGYTIAVDRAGFAVVNPENGTPPHRVMLAPNLVARFFAALDGAAPLAALPAAPCGKSKSFGYSIVVRYNGATTPDLTCPAGDTDATLASLAAAIASSANMPNAAPRHPFPAPAAT
jgi:hypothetical protein